MSETGTATHSVATAYDQYEVAIPLERAGDCLLRFSEEVYGSRALWRGFRTPPLIRFVSHEDAYLSLTHDGPAMYINLEVTLSPGQGGGCDAET